MKSTRRNFLKRCSLAAAPMIVPASVLGRDGHTAPSNRITIGGVGLGARGRFVLQRFLEQSDVQFVAVADPQAERSEAIRRYALKLFNLQDIATMSDMYQVFERPDIDAVIIATGERWHAVASMIAAAHGKDVYCEKPCSMTIAEATELDLVMRRYGRVFQAGTQRRSVPNFQVAARLAREGRLGELTGLHASIRNLAPDKPWLPAEPMPDPAKIDWDRWLGPSPWRPFNIKYCHGGWRFHHGLAAGYNLPDWGAHTIDLCQWAANKDGTAPVHYEAIDDNTIKTRYADGLPLTLRLGGFRDEGNWTKGIGTCPVRFEGKDGWVEAGDSGKLAVSNPALLEGIGEPPVLAGTDPVQHVRDFLDCVKTRKQPVCNATVARYGHLGGHAAAIAWKVGRGLTFDPVSETFPQDDEANRMRSRARRAPWHSVVLNAPSPTPLS